MATIDSVHGEGTQFQGQRHHPGVEPAVELTTHEPVQDEADRDAGPERR